MKKIKFTIKAKLKRNTMHFEIQKRTRMQVFEDKTKYSRKRLKRLTVREVKGEY